MKTATQYDYHRCECGRLAAVTQTASPHEFEWRCACGAAGSISWAHVKPPPAWRPMPGRR